MEQSVEFLENRILENKTIINEEIVFDNKSMNFLGPNLTFENCNIVLNLTSQNLLNMGVIFKNCWVTVKKALVNYHWAETVFDNCSFKGKFSGNDFGHLPEENTIGNVIDSDFSEAILDGCRFLDCDTKRITFPKWKCFTIIEPFSHKEQIKKADWENKLKYSIIPDEEFDPSNLTAFTLFAARYVKSESIEEKQLFEKLSKLNFVVL